MLNRFGKIFLPGTRYSTTRIKGGRKLAGALRETPFGLFDYVLVINLDDWEDQFPETWTLREISGRFRLYEPDQD
jgi:hypothetical protein